ncbi:hypothetical protein [Hyphomonas sp.]|uniref:hypothetical protein n=1 Tax=Hyphomonas sp. TaxID=87 RepID=UPI003918C10E
MTHLRILALAAALLAGPVAAAQANGAQDAALCRTMSATLAPRQAEIRALTSDRDAAATAAEDLGDVWEEAETHRLVSAARAREADAARTAYDEARQLLARRELALQSAVRQYNTDIEAFNARCTRQR